MVAFSGSKIHRATMCTASTYLPREESEASIARERGTGFHAFPERCAKIGYEAALADIPLDAPHRSLCEAVNPLLLPIAWDKARHEVAFAFDLATGEARELVGAKERDYSGVRDTEIAGTVDLLEITDESVTVSDWKTGRWDAAHQLQLAAYGLMVSTALGRDAITTRAIYVEESTGEARIAPSALDEFALADVHRQLRELDARCRADAAEWRATGVQTTRTGDHCRYCDCRAACREYSNAGRDLATAAMAQRETFIERVRSEIKTPIGAARWFQFLELAPAAIDAVRKELEAAAPLDLGDGRHVAMVAPEGKRTVKDADAVYKELVEMGRGAAAEEACVIERSTTMAKLAKSLGGGKGADAIIERLIARKAGIAKSQPQPKLTVVESK